MAGADLARRAQPSRTAPRALAGRTGERHHRRAVTLYDDALAGEDGCPTAPFDAEGTPRRRVAFLDAGVAREVVHDRAIGRARAERARPATPRRRRRAVRRRPRRRSTSCWPPATQPSQELIARVERGLLVARFHYVNGLLDTRRALMTGMTRDGLWLHRERPRRRPAANLRWTESLLDAGRAPRRHLRAPARSSPAACRECWFVCPTMLVRGWKFIRLSGTILMICAFIARSPACAGACVCRRRSRAVRSRRSSLRRLAARRRLPVAAARLRRARPARRRADRAAGWCWPAWWRGRLRAFRSSARR